MKEGVLMSLEIWKPIEDFDNYEVSSWGRVRNKTTEKILKPYENDKGYLKVEIYHDGIGCKKRINRLVAAAFIDNPANLPCVDHIDGNKQNNSVTNLRWATDRANRLYAKKLRAIAEELDPSIALWRGNGR